MKPSNVTPEEFIFWRKSLGYSPAAAAKNLGVSPSTVSFYENGKRKEGVVKIPVTVALAMSALSAKLKPYGETNL